MSPFTKFDMSIADASVQQAQAAVDLAELALAESVVVSPLDGVVVERFQSVGALIGPQNPIVSVISGEVEMVLGVEESQIGQVREGEKAEIAVAAYPGVAFPAKVTLVGPWPIRRADLHREDQARGERREVEAGDVRPGEDRYSGEGEGGAGAQGSRGRQVRADVGVRCEGRQCGDAFGYPWDAAGWYGRGGQRRRGGRRGGGRRPDRSQRRGPGIQELTLSGVPSPATFKRLCGTRHSALGFQDYSSTRESC